jgi:hypothetical protein
MTSTRFSVTCWHQSHLTYAPNHKIACTDIGRSAHPTIVGPGGRHLRRVTQLPCADLAASLGHGQQVALVLTSIRAGPAGEVAPE